MKKAMVKEEDSNLYVDGEGLSRWWNRKIGPFHRLQRKQRQIFTERVEGGKWVSIFLLLGLVGLIEPTKSLLNRTRVQNLV